MICVLQEQALVDVLLDALDFGHGRVVLVVDVGCHEVDAFKTLLDLT